MPEDFDGFDARAASKQRTRSAAVGGGAYSISKQPGLAPRNAGVLFGLELEKRTTSQDISKKKKGARIAESTNSVVGFRAVVREGFSRGHIVEIRKKRKDEGMFGAVELPSCLSCISGAEASSSVSGKGYTSTVFSTKDIEFIEIVESSLEMDAAAAAGGPCAMCAPCCSFCCPGEEEAAKIEMSDKAIAVHLANRKFPVSIDWSDIMGQIDDQPETCCQPGMRRNYQDKEITHKDGTHITAHIGSERSALPKFLAMCPCCGSMDMQEEEVVVAKKYFVDATMKDKVAYPDEPISSLAMALMALQVENRGSTPHSAAGGAPKKGAKANSGAAL